MKTASLMLLGSILFASAAAVACNAAPYTGDDVASLAETSGKRTPQKDDDAANTPVQSPTSSGGAASTATTESAPLDAGAPVPAIDAFTNAPAFTELTPATDTSDHHVGDANAGKDCLSCHGENNGAPRFALGGTLHETSGQPDGATGAQVRIVGPDGTELALVGTDAEGNFWLAGTTVIPAGSHVGVRDGTTTKKMTGTISAGSCNTAGCHDSTRPMFLNTQ